MHLQEEYLAVLYLSLCLLAATTADRTRLVFNSKGGFKLAVFADLHYGEAENLTWGPYQDSNSTVVMKKMLVLEKPDFVMYSGDQLTGENIGDNATAYWGRVVEPCVNTQTKWAVIFGNHDDLSSSGGSRKDLLSFDTKFPLSYSQFGPPLLHGLTNYYLLVYSSETAKNPSWILYMLDSGGGSYPELVYDDQIQWLVNASSQLTAEYGSILAIAFFHIPSTGYEGGYSQSLCRGTNNDTVSPQTQANKLLSILFTQANVHMTVVGHNHGNDWCCPFQGSGHMICYARHTGYGGYGTWMRGSRVLILKEGGKLSTYVRMEDERIINKPI